MALNREPLVGGLSKRNTEMTLEQTRPVSLKMCLALGAASIINFALKMWQVRLLNMGEPGGHRH